MAVKQSNVLTIKTVKRIKFAIIIIVSILVVNKEYVAIMPFALQNNTQPSVDVRRVSKEIQWPVVYQLIIAQNQFVTDRPFVETKSVDMTAFVRQRRISVRPIVSPDVEVLMNARTVTLTVRQLLSVSLTSRAI
jgi:hypothetical protein